MAEPALSSRSPDSKNPILFFITLHCFIVSHETICLDPKSDILESNQSSNIQQSRALTGMACGKRKKKKPRDSNSCVQCIEMDFFLNNAVRRNALDRLQYERYCTDMVSAALRWGQGTYSNSGPFFFFFLNYLLEQRFNRW